MADATINPKYSIIIPALNESLLIEKSLTALSEYLHEIAIFDTTEVIVVAAEGGDNTAELVRPFKHSFQYFQLIEPGPKVGKGRDVRAGIEAAHGALILFMDADLATPIHHIKEAFHILEEQQADVVIGVRHLWKIHKTLGRKIMSVTANLLVRILLLPRVPDSQCGFKAFTHQAAKMVFGLQTINGWAFDMELLVIAEKKGLKIAKLPIKDWADPKLDSGLVGESPMQASINTFKELWRIRRQRAKGLYQ